MDTFTLMLQVIIALAIFNVWILRYGKPSDWRGGEARNMKEEFEVYGLPGWLMGSVGFLKIALAALLIAGIWLPTLTRPAAVGIALLMLGAVAMHLKVNDPIRKAVPSASLLILAVVVAAA